MAQLLSTKFVSFFFFRENSKVKPIESSWWDRQSFFDVNANIVAVKENDDRQHFRFCCDAKASIQSIFIVRSPLTSRELSRAIRSYQDAFWKFLKIIERTFDRSATFCQFIILWTTLFGLRKFKSSSSLMSLEIRFDLSSKSPRLRCDYFAVDRQLLQIESHISQNKCGRNNQTRLSSLFIIHHVSHRTPRGFPRSFRHFHMTWPINAEKVIRHIFPLIMNSLLAVVQTSVINVKVNHSKFSSSTRQRFSHISSAWKTSNFLSSLTSWDRDDRRTPSLALESFFSGWRDTWKLFYLFLILSVLDCRA